MTINKVFKNDFEVTAKLGTIELYAIKTRYEELRDFSARKYLEVEDINEKDKEYMMFEHFQEEINKIDKIMDKFRED